MLTKTMREQRKALYDAMPQDERDRLDAFDWRITGWSLVAFTVPFGILAIVFAITANTLAAIPEAPHRLMAEGVVYSLSYAIMAASGPAFAVALSWYATGRKLRKWHLDHETGLVPSPRAAKKAAPA